MFSLYLVTNTHNGKRYVGITRFSVRKRWLQHLQAARNPKAYGGLLSALRKYGPDAFTMEVIGHSDDWDTLKAMEQQAIQDYNTYAPNGQGYNLTLGGDGNLGYIPSPEQKAAMSARMQGRNNSEETRARLSVALREAIAAGRKIVGFFSEEHRTAFFAAHKDYIATITGKPRAQKPSEETRALWIQQRTGKKASPESRAKMSASQTGMKVPSRGRKGRVPWNKGVPATPEHREKAAAHSQGARNGRARPIELDGVQYAYMKEAMVLTGRSRIYIYARLRDGRARYLDEEDE